MSVRRRSRARRSARVWSGAIQSKKIIDNLFKSAYPIAHSFSRILPGLDAVGDLSAATGACRHKR